MKYKLSQENLAEYFLIHLLIVFAIFTRLIPHPENFTSIGAVGLFAGAFLSGRLSLFAPLLALIVSDAVLGFYEPIVMLFVYIGTVSSVLIGHIFLFQKIGIIRLLASALVSAIIFFIISNFGMWASGFYPPTLNGLTVCYFAAIPFFKNILAGNLIYAFLLFGIYLFLRNKIRRFQFQFNN